MKKLLLAAGMLFSTFAMNAIIPGTEDKPLEMYALGASGTTGVYRFNPTDWANPTKISTDELGATGYTGSNYKGGGTFMSADRVVGVKYNYGAYVFDVTAEGNGQGPWSGTIKSASFQYEVFDMAYDELNDIVYCWCNMGSMYSPQHTLAIYDPTAQTITRVGNADSAQMRTLAIDNNGQLWGINGSGYLYKIDKTTGAATEVKGWPGLGITFESAPSSAAVDPASNMMYVVAKTGMFNGFSTLYKVDLEDAGYKTENLGDLPKIYNCLWIAGSSLSDNVPAMVEDLTAEFNGEATVVSFTAPKLTIGGAALSGELTYTVKVDGEEAATGKVAAGATAKVTINPTDGKHEISVTVSNDEGESKSAKTSVYSGYDTPKAVTDLKIAAEDGSLKFTWNAPESQNGGLLDMSKITYTITLGDETIASGLKETEYTCTIDWSYAQRTYKVTVVNGETAGESAQASVMSGLPYELPYTLDLADAASLEAMGMTVFDLEGGRSGKWAIAQADGEKVLQSYSEPVFKRNDYVYLPPMELKAGEEYALKFTATSYTTANNHDDPASLYVLIASEPTTDSEQYTQLQKIELITERKVYHWTECSVKFNVEKDGVYSLAFADLSQGAYTAYYELDVKDLTVAVDAPEGDAYNLAIETVSVPTEMIAAHGKGDVTVKVSNAGYENVGEGDYDVALYCGDEKVEILAGKALEAGESAEYTFEIVWTAQSPDKAEYTVKVLFADDENEEDNATEPFTVAFDKSTGISDVAASDVEIATDGASIVVKNAGGSLVVVYSVDGRIVASGVAEAEYMTPSLTTGMYIVKAGELIKKIVVRAI